MPRFAFLFFFAACAVAGANDRKAFHDAIGAHPGDDLVKLVYCDWMEERGEGRKAELLRLMVALNGRPDATFEEVRPLLLRYEALLNAGGRNEFLGSEPWLAAYEAYLAHQYAPTFQRIGAVAIFDTGVLVGAQTGSNIWDRQAHRIYVAATTQLPATALFLRVVFPMGPGMSSWARDAVVRGPRALDFPLASHFFSTLQGGHPHPSDPRSCPGILYALAG